MVTISCMMTITITSILLESDVSTTQQFIMTFTIHGTPITIGTAMTLSFMDLQST